MWRTSISNTLQMNASSEYSQPRVSSGNDSRNWSSFQGSQLIQSRWALFIVEFYWRVGNVRLPFDVYLLCAFEKKLRNQQIQENQMGNTLKILCWILTLIVHFSFSCGCLFDLYESHLNVCLTDSRFITFLIIYVAFRYKFT